MNDRENLLAAFDGKAARCPAVLLYPNILIRDHWAEVTDLPWTAYYHSALPQRVKRWRDCMAATGMQWAQLPESTVSDADRENLEFQHTDGETFLVNRAKDERRKLTPPGDYLGSQSHGRETVIHCEDDIDVRLPEECSARAAKMFDDGRFREALFMRERMDDVFLYSMTCSPFTTAADYFTFEDFLTAFYDKPDLMHALLARTAKARTEQIELFRKLGSDAVFIQDIYCDLVSAETYREFAAAYLKEIIESIRGAGMKSILHFTGNPQGKLEMLLSVKPDALAFEEGKKRFENNIADLAAQIDGQSCLFGNLDSIGVLQNGDEQLICSEVEKQWEAGRVNGGRFIFCTGSPVTPSTALENVRRFFKCASSTWKR